MTIGEKIQSLRKSKCLSQEQLAEKLNISRQAISKWEAEQSIPEIDKIIALSDFFTVSTDYLLKDDQQITDSKEDMNSVTPTTNFEKDADNERNQKISVALFAVAIMLYIVCAVPLLVLQNEIGLVILLIIVAIATGLIIFRASFNSRNDIQEEKAEDTTDPRLKTIKSTVNILFVVVYFIVSFFTGAWHITWIIFLISAVIKRIIDSVYELRVTGAEPHMVLEMKKALLIKISILSVLTITLTAILIFALISPDKMFKNGFINILGINIGNQTVVNYEESESYSIGNAEIALNITSLDIEWIEGNVNIIPYEGTKVKIEEKYDDELDGQYNLRYKVENGRLTIKPCASVKLPYILKDMFEKELNIYIPYELSEKLIDIKINTTSAYIHIGEAIHTETMNIITISGQISLTDIYCDTMQLESVSGHINLSNISTRVLKASNTSGQTKLNAKNIDKLTIESVSGRIIAETLNAPQSADLESVSGEITFKIPENDGFTLDFDTVSGCISSDFNTGSNAIYKNGEKQYNIETVSSNVLIAKSN